ncbi:MAG: shikimate dehydrogenase, partial [Candidatus Limnocylindria bacterium]
MTALAVLLGHGIGYSASPAIHNAAFAALELNARYELRDVDSLSLADEVAALLDDGRIGANVT